MNEKQIAALCDCAIPEEVIAQLKHRDLMKPSVIADIVSYHINLGETGFAKDIIDAWEVA